MKNKSYYSKVYKYDKNYRFKEYERAAISRKLNFDLSFDEFILFWNQKCYYCGDVIETIGLDRLENTKGYSIENIVSCCFSCNQLKSTKSFDEFIKQIKEIYLFSIENKKEI